MRTTFIALGAIGSLGAILAAGCGGGGSSSTPSTVSSPAPLSSINPNQGVNNFTGPSSQVTVSINVPARAPVSKAIRSKLHQLYGPRSLDKNVRSMANTSPTASIRAAGLQQDRWSQGVFQRTGRDPSFVSNATTFMEFVLTDVNNNVLVDQTGGCTTGNCTHTFTVPIGTSYTATLYLYDNCDFLLSAGSVGNVSVVAGVNPGLTITLNGVVTYFDVETTGATTPFLADPSGAQSFNVTVTPLDVDFNGHTTVTTPGVLIDSTFTQITSVNLALDPTATDVTPAGTTSVPVPPNLILAPTAYSFSGTGTETQVMWTATPVTTGVPIVPSFNTWGSPQTTAARTLTITDNAPTLTWTNPNNYPLASGDPQFAATSATNWNVEFPLQTNSNSYTFGLNENATVGFTSITLSAANCGISPVIVASYNPAVPGTYLYSALSGGVQFTMGSTGPTSTCVVTATDDAVPARTATLSFFTDSSNLTIQSKTRKH